MTRQESVGWCPCCFAGADEADAAEESHEQLCDECAAHAWLAEWRRENDQSRWPDHGERNDEAGR